MARHKICQLDEFPTDTRRVVDIDGKQIAVFNVGGKFHAIANTCPHKGAPLCTNPPTGMMRQSEPDVYDYGREGEVVRCPWHGHEYNLSDGKSVVAPLIKQRVRVYEVEVADNEIAVLI